MKFKILLNQTIFYFSDKSFRLKHWELILRENEVRVQHQKERISWLKMTAWKLCADERILMCLSDILNLWVSFPWTLDQQTSIGLQFHQSENKMQVKGLHNRFVSLFLILYFWIFNKYFVILKCIQASLFENQPDAQGWGAVVPKHNLNGGGHTTRTCSLQRWGRGSSHVRCVYTH